MKLNKIKSDGTHEENLYAFNVTAKTPELAKAIDLELRKTFGENSDGCPCFEDCETTTFYIISEEVIWFKEAYKKAKKDVK